MLPSEQGGGHAGLNLQVLGQEVTQSEVVESHRNAGVGCRGHEADDDVFLCGVVAQVDRGLLPSSLGIHRGHIIGGHLVDQSPLSAVNLQGEVAGAGRRAVVFEVEFCSDAALKRDLAGSHDGLVAGGFRGEHHRASVAVGTGGTKSPVGRALERCAPPET